jgi:hypothetical protein
MTDDSLARHLAGRFADDARALRARADALAAAPGGHRRSAGPDAAACRAMATACDRVEALFRDAPDEAAVRAALPTLAGMLAGARADHERHVYAGAVARVNQALAGGDGAHDDDADDELDDDEEDDA